MNERAISNEMAAVIMVAISIVATIGVAYFFLGLTSLVPSLEVNIDPRIYSVNSNIGVLNEEATFRVSLKNNGNYTREITTTIAAEDSVLVNTTVDVDPESAKNQTITQKLIYPGTWIIRVFSEDHETLDSYSFITVTNSIDADMQINALSNVQDIKNSSIFSNIIALSSLAVSIAALTVSVLHIRQRPRKQKETSS